MINLINGDCLEKLKDIPSHSVDLIVTDPPYEMSINHDGGNLYEVKKMTTQQKDIVNSNLDLGYDIEKFGKEFLRVMKDINIYVWCNKKQIPDYFNFYVNKHKCKFDILTWHKTNPLPTYYNKYVNDTEFLLYFHKGKGQCKPLCYDDAFTYYIAPINSVDKKKWKHPTVKPLDIIMRVVKNSSKEHQLVLDPFMGSGTTGVACKALDRDFIGIEINEEYYGIAQDRIQNDDDVKFEKISLLDDTDNKE